jgi:hypothetical protein
MGHVPRRVWLHPWLGATRVVPVVLITNRPMFMGHCLVARRVLLELRHMKPGSEGHEGLGISWPSTGQRMSFPGCSYGERETDPHEGAPVRTAHHGDAAALRFGQDPADG